MCLKTNGIYPTIGKNNWYGYKKLYLSNDAPQEDILLDPWFK